MAPTVRVGITDQAGRIALATLGALVATLVVATSAAQAGSYRVETCGGAFAGIAGGDWEQQDSTSGYDTFSNCGSGGDDAALKIRQVATVADGKADYIILRAAPGSEMTRIKSRINFLRENGSFPRFTYARNSGPAPGSWGNVIFGNTSAGWTNTSTTLSPGSGAFWAALSLTCGPGNCANSNARAWGKAFEFTIWDRTAPTISPSGSLIDGQVKRGTHSLGATLQDGQGGLVSSFARINGTNVKANNHSCPGVSGALAGRIVNPCEAASTINGGTPLSLNTAGSPFVQETNNTVQICATDYANIDQGNTGCYTKSIHVDNVAPKIAKVSQSPSPTTWINSNSAQVNWQNTANGPHAKIHWRVTGPGGYSVQQSKTTGNLQQLRDSEIPFGDLPGTYTVRVWAEDAYGNVNEGFNQEWSFQVDKTIPNKAQLEKNSGWVNAADGNHRQRWTPPAAPPSGLAGFAVKINQLESYDPCGGGGSTACDSFELNYPPGTTFADLDAEDLPEGRWYVHSVAASNAGNRSAVDTVSLLVDRTPPDAALRGLPDGWSRESVPLTVEAVDLLSGMSLSDVEPNEPPPITAIGFNRQPYKTEEGSTVSDTLSGDGIHTVRYWARDVAGNKNDGSTEDGYSWKAPKTATVKIDGTAPVGSFMQAPVDDPELQRLNVTDATSGVGSVKIQLRKVETEQWYDLELSKEASDEYQARIDSTKWEVGRYEMRAVSTDIAGNAGVIDRYGDGERVYLDLPLKSGSRIAVGFVKTKTQKFEKGKTRGVLSYDQSPTYAGRLTDPGGEPIANAPIRVRERADKPGRPKVRFIQTKTDRKGRFGVTGAVGPSRNVRALYAGNKRYQPTRSEYIRLVTRGRIRLTKWPKKIGNKEQIVLGGEVMHRNVKVPPNGKVYEIQVRVPIGKKKWAWQTVKRATRTKGDGKFTFRYRLKNKYARKTRFSFRAKMKRDNLFPYLGATSNVVRVTVVP